MDRQISLPLLKIGARPSLTGRFVAKGIFPELSLRQQQSLDRTFMRSIVDDQSNRLSFYRIKTKRKYQESKHKMPAVKEMRKILKQNGNILLISEIYTNLKPSAAEEDSLARDINVEYDRENPKLVQDLDFFKKKSESSMSEELRRYFKEDRWQAVNTILKFKLVIKNHQVLASWKVVENLLEGQNLHTKKYVEHLHNTKLQKQILSQLQTIQHNIVRMEDITGFKQQIMGLMGKASAFVKSREEAKHKETMREIQALESCLQEVYHAQKRQKDLQSELVECLIINYRYLAKSGKNIARRGICEHLLCLKVMHVTVDVADVCPLVLTESKAVLLRLVDKMYDLEIANCKLECLIEMLKEYLDRNKKVLACLNEFKSVVKKERSSEDDDWGVFRYLYRRFLVAEHRNFYRPLLQEFEKRVQQSNINNYSQQFIASVIDIYSVSKFKLKQLNQMKMISKLMERNREESQVDPALLVDILTNETKLRREKKTSQEIIREEAICNLKRWLAEKESKESLQFQRRKTEAQLSRSDMHEPQHKVNISALIDSFRDIFMRTYNSLTKDIGNLKADLKEMEQLELGSMVRYFKQHRQQNNFFEIASIMFGESMAEEHLKKSPLVKGLQHHDSSEIRIDYNTLIRLSLLHNDLFKK